MANLADKMTPRTVTAIYEHYVSSRKGGHRPHLGGSQIGRECDRALWYQFRHAKAPEFPGRVLRLFETGDREEDRLIANLRAIGVTVWARDPETGGQFRFTAHGGHFALSLDGVCEGLPDAPKTPHTLEFKTMNDRNFRALEKDGVQKSKPVYWAQCQVGMHLAGLTRCAFMAVNKNDDSIYMERVRYDKEAAQALIDRAEAIIFADKPPARISNDPSFYICKFCEFRDLCHGQELPEVNFRTCAHVTPERDGTWSCDRGCKEGRCEAHVFNPHMMPQGWEVEDAGDDWVDYRRPDGVIVRNGDGNGGGLAE